MLRTLVVVGSFLDSKFFKLADHKCEYVNGQKAFRTHITPKRIQWVTLWKETIFYEGTFSSIYVVHLIATKWGTLYI